jgi:hypothetical protein
MTPSAWAIQQLGHNLIYAITLHITMAMTKIADSTRSQNHPAVLLTASTSTHRPRNRIHVASSFVTSYAAAVR